MMETRLSRALHAASLADEAKLRRIHNSNYHRLEKLIEADTKRAVEYQLLKRHILNSPSTKWLIAVEYEIDDGGRMQGHGDAVFYDGSTMYVVECKRTDGPYCTKREMAVRRQAIKYVSRIKSWLVHLGQTDPPMAKMGMSVVPGIVIDDAKLRVLHT